MRRGVGTCAKVKMPQSETHTEPLVARRAGCVVHSPVKRSQSTLNNIIMQKMHFVTHEAHRQGKRVYRVDIDSRNAFNAMSQAALWHLMNMFHIPDVDLLEQIYDSATVRLAPNVQFDRCSAKNV